MERDKIIDSIKKNITSQKPLPENPPSPAGINGGQLSDVFKKSLEQVGADYLEFNVKDEEEIDTILDSHYRGAINLRKKELWEEYSSNCSKDKLNQIGTVIMEGQFGVAENGAIWIDDSNFPNRLIPFIASQVIILLDPENIVRNMHEAYNRIGLEETGFGLFISGPSKTADIEQSLVYGAHGAIGLTVLFLY